MEVAQQQAAEQALQQAQDVLNTLAIAAQLRAAQVAFLVGRHHSRRGLSERSGVAESMRPDLTSIPLIEGSACDTVQGEVDDGHSYA